jgi:hypothetical protein
MNRLVVVLAALVIVVGILGFAAGYVLHPSGGSVEFTQRADLSGKGLSCGPSNQPPYLAGTLQFNLTSTYWTDVIVSVAYLGNWTGDTNQLVHPNSTKHVAVTWGPGAMQSISVTQCPVVGVVIWRVVQTIMTCPNPPCDDGTIPAP